MDRTVGEETMAAAGMLAAGSGPLAENSRNRTVAVLPVVIVPPVDPAVEITVCIDSDVHVAAIPPGAGDPVVLVQTLFPKHHRVAAAIRTRCEIRVTVG